MSVLFPLLFAKAALGLRGHGDILNQTAMYTQFTLETEEKSRLCPEYLLSVVLGVVEVLVNMQAPET